MGIITSESPEFEYAEKIFTTLIISILLTAPTGALLITLLGSKLLTKTKYSVTPKEWRKCHRPSIRDISILEEEEIEPEGDHSNRENMSVQEDVPTIKSPDSRAGDI